MKAKADSRGEQKRKAFIDGNLIWVLAAVAMLVVAHVVVSKFVMKGK